MGLSTANRHWFVRVASSTIPSQTSLAINGGYRLTSFKEYRQRIFAELDELLEAKGNDYTAGGSCFSNFEACEQIGIDRLNGLIIRLLDKVARVKSFAKSGQCQVKNESVDDAFMDIIGYSLIALAMRHEDLTGEIFKS
jgi:hypothetical protein